ncbi:MAG: transferrin-binding protein-like solute binding protein [Proteobacteria bacterium]|nr:transferrin-binding protein-like solute binding protein [Pseudomonadota bacterium]
MFKTILKAVALSATTLTLLSACGALASLNAALNAQEEADRRAAVAVPVLVAVEEPEYDYLERYGYDYDPETCSDCTELEIAELKARIEAEKERIATIEDDRIAEQEHLAALASLEAELASLEAEKERLETIQRNRIAEQEYLTSAERNRIAELEYRVEQARIEEKRLAKIESDRLEEKRRATEEIRLIDEALLAEQTRWDESVLPRVKYEPAPVAVRAAAINVTLVEDDDRVFNMFAFDPIKANDEFSLVIGENDVITVNGVDYAFIDELLIDPRAHPPSGHIFGSLYAWHENAFDRTFTDNKAIIFSSEGRNNADIRQVVKGIHPTVQGDYFEYRTKLDYSAFYETENENDKYNYTTGFATVGIQTDAAAVQSQTAVAIYRGQGRLHSYITLREYIHTYYQDATLAMTMSVDFDANTIEGTGRRKTDDQDEFSQANVFFNSAPIVGNGFSGTFTLNGPMREWYHLINNPTGQYSGNFFGPNADDLAGVMSFGGTSRIQTYDSDGSYNPVNAEVIGSGGFRADRQ